MTIATQRVARLLGLCGGVVAAAAACSATATAADTLYFAPSYATSTLNVAATTTWTAEQEPSGKPDRLQIVTGSAVPGTGASKPSGALRARIAIGDVTTGPGDRKRRAEMLWNGRLFGSGSIVWLSFPIMIPTSTALTGPSNAWTVIYQWHGADRLSPPVTLGVTRGGRYIIDSGLTGVADVDLGPVVRGTWQRITLGVRFASDSTGWVEGYLDGVSLAGRRSHPTLGAGQSVYAKEGWYEGWNWGDWDRMAYHGPIRIGSSKTIVTAS